MHPPLFTSHPFLLLGLEGLVVCGSTMARKGGESQAWSPSLGADHHNFSLFGWTCLYVLKSPHFLPAMILHLSGLESCLFLRTTVTQIIPGLGNEEGPGQVWWRQALVTWWQNKEEEEVLFLMAEQRFGSLWNQGLSSLCFQGRRSTPSVIEQGLHLKTKT